ncbi:histidine kinase [Caproiciproducens sp. LBM24188]
MRNLAAHFRTRMKRMKIRSQLILVFLIAGFVPIFIIGSYLVINNRNMVQKQHAQLVAAYNVRTRSIILDATTSVYNIAASIVTDDQLQTLLSTRYQSDEQFHEVCRNYNKLDSYYSGYAEVSNITLYCNNPTMSDYGRIKVATEQDKKTKWYQEASKSPIPHWMTWIYNDQRGNRIVQLRVVYRVSVVSTGGFAILAVDVNNNHLNSGISADPMETVISVNDDPVFYSTNSSLTGKNMPMAIDRTQDVFRCAGIFPFDGKNQLLQVSTFVPVYSNDKIYIATVDTDALPNMKSILFNCLLIVLFSLLVPFIMMFFFSKTFSDRITTLCREMQKVGQGNYDIIQDYNGNGELMDLFTNLQTMIESIKSRDQEIYETKMVKQRLINHQQKMEFKMLSSQINPHFLYNTLESIRMKAYMNQDIEVANAVKLLGKSLRYVLEKSDSMVTLQSELEYITIYLEIQKVRFKDRINYGFSVSNGVNCGECMVLPLLLQPIVENAVLHGLEETESGGFIQISVEKRDSDLSISISDNGCGIAQQELAQLMEKINSLNENAAEGMGLHNVQRRLKLFYGEKYGLTIASKPGSGTKVTVLLPMQGKGEA